ncbi:MAG: hypothetical protein KAG66_24015, partial [Methylococcales bacterium]|nr:hypothetical protein [Methylococcales bacterium]
AGGASEGTGAIVWEACTSLSPVTCGSIAAKDITAIRFNVPTLQAAAGGKIVKIELTPMGNQGGVPDIDADSTVTAASTGDIYTNTFGGRVPEISLLVISNDVSVTMVSGSIGDYVWMDTDADGVQDGSEAAIPDVTLQLLDSAGDPVYVDPATGGIVPSDSVGAVPYTATTDATGLYLFDNLPAGDYQVQVDSSSLPTSVEQTFDADGIGSSNVSAVTLLPVTDVLGNITDIDHNDTQDFGYQQLATIGDRVWEDLNGDGIQDAGETGVDNVTVTLYDINGGVLDTTTTSNGGQYSFTQLSAGNYVVGFSNFPAGYTLTDDNQGGFDGLDSNADPLTGNTGT